MGKYRNKLELIVDYLKESECHSEERELGVEVEHFVLESQSLKATTYYEEDGIEDLLTELTERNWEPKWEEGRVVGLEGESARVALEPGGQLELSILPQDSVEDLRDIYLDFVREVVAILDGWGNALFCLGYQPKSKIEEIPLLPKKRYTYMHDYFGNKGKYAHHMMKSTSAIHVNFDYFDEEDYVKKNLVANVLSPLVYTVLDNSPFFESEVTENEGLRRSIWENCDSERCGFPPGLFKAEFGYRDYAEYLLNTPPMVYEKGGELVYSKDKLLKEILLEDLDPNVGELEYLLTTVFPDVRTKNHLEIRMGDSLPYPYSFAYLCFWKGLLYSEDNLDNLYKIFKDITRDQFIERKRKLTEKGLAASWGSDSILSAYRDLLELAEQGLESGESVYLKPLKQLAEKEITPRQKTLNFLSEGKAKALSWCNLNEIIN
ncbi:glutamate--cysteine ligase [Candidatus Bipolaricaulota bacterium]|nr:glutamate--cysteine ligase [Candidatus Bipolaricaulota bacterium]